MALGAGFNTLNANTNTFSDWLNKTNEMITLFREEVVTANSSSANTDGNAILNGSFVANTIVAATELRGGTLTDSNTLYVTTNTEFTNANVRIENNLEIDGDLIYILTPNNYIHLIPSTNGNDLGNTSYRWNAFLINTDIINANVSTLTVTSDSQFGGPVTFSNTVTFEEEISFSDLSVTGVASIANLEVSSLVTNTAALIGTSGNVVSNAVTVIDSFDAISSKGFKYIVHGVNADANSAYAVEIMCAHNGTQTFFTRFAEVSNAFDCELTPQVNGSLIELIAVCPSANSTNTHSFNIVRIETR